MSRLYNRSHRKVLHRQIKPNQTEPSRAEPKESRPEKFLQKPAHWFVKFGEFRSIGSPNFFHLKYWKMTDGKPSSQKEEEEDWQGWNEDEDPPEDESAEALAKLKPGLMEEHQPPTPEIDPEQSNDQEAE
jgi:hypothetical protein